MLESSASSKFDAFIRVEREHYEENNRVAFSLGQVSRYLRFMDMILARYRLQSHIVATCFQRRMQEAREKPGIRTLAPEEVEEVEAESRSQNLLHLEIESHFLFTKILLDKIAQFIGDFFGSVRGVSLQSHNDLCKSLPKYSKAKGLTIPADMYETMACLNSGAVQFRDKGITHLKNPRASHGTFISHDGRSQIATSVLYPKPTDVGHVSPSIEDVTALVEKYVEQFIGLVANNRNRSRYRLLVEET